MKIKEIEVENFGAWAGKRKFNTDANLVFLVGENNTGKTTLLRAIQFLREGFKDDELNKVRHIPVKDSDNISVKIEDDNSNSYERSNEKNECKSIFKNETEIKPKAIADDFNVEFISSGKDPDEAVSFTSTKPMGKLLKKFSEDFTSGDDWKELKKAYDRAFYNGKNSLTKKSEELSNNIQEALKDIYPNIGVELAFQGLDVGDFTKGGNINLNDGVNTPASQKGSGLQRALAFAILKTYAEMERKSETRNSIFLIDEPEISMHPRMQKNLMESLRKISKAEQVFISTHSPYILKEFNKDRDKILTFSRNNKEIEHKELTDWNLLPYSPSLAEINYYAYKLPTSEFHNELYGCLHEKYISKNVDCKKNREINIFDGFIKQYGNLPERTWHNDAKTNPQTVSLATFIRHKMHHPENKKMVGVEYDDKELKKSISALIDLITNFDGLKVEK